MDVWDAPEEVWEDASEADSTEVLWTLTEEIWADIPPVRHRRHKNEFPTNLPPLC